MNANINDLENNETQTQNPFISLWKEHLDEARLQISDSQPLWSVGHLTKINGLVMEAKGLKIPLGGSCLIYPEEGNPVEAEVVGFEGDQLYLMPSEEVSGLAPGSKVEPFENPASPFKLGS